MTIKAIETQYKGYRFRSRLEARWAVFFDALGMAWEYEKEGFEIDGERYLPDFYLPDSRLWVEIKAVATSQEEADKILAFIREKKDNFLLVFGQPYLGEEGNAYRCEYTGIFYPATLLEPTGNLLRLNSELRCWRVTGLALCRSCKALYWMFGGTHELAAAPFDSCCDAPLLLDLPYDAYAKARGARFEHGETPE